MRATLRDWWRRVWVFPRMGLGIKMTLIVIIGVFSLVGLFGYLGAAALEETVHRSAEERILIAQTAARFVDYNLVDIEHALRQAAANEALIEPHSRAEALRAIFPHLSSFGSQLYVLDAAGRVVAAYPAVSTEVALADAPPTQRVLRGQPFALSQQAYTAGAVERWTLAAAPLYDASAHIVGALVLQVDLGGSRLYAFADRVRLGNTGYMDLIDTAGVILASTRPERVGQSSDHDTTLARMIQLQQPFASRCHSCHTTAALVEPQAEMLAFAPLKNAQWGVTVRQDESEVLAAARAWQWRVLALGTVALSVALVLVYLATRSVVAPVQALTAATQRIAAGDLETPIEMRSAGEIGALARAFDAMRAQLKDSIAETRAWARELDTRVQERTAALAAAQRQADESREQLQMIIDSIGDDLLVIDREYRVRRVNAAVQRRHTTAPQIIGAYCYAVTHVGSPCQSPDCECPLPAVFATGKPFRVTHFHADHGSPRYLDIIASPLFDAAGQVTGAVELMRDVTEERKLEETLLQRNRELSAVNAITRVVGGSLRLEELLHAALAEVQRITRMDVGSIHLLEGEGCALKLYACYGISEEVAEITKRMALVDTACGGVLQIGETTVVQNVPNSMRARVAMSASSALVSLIHVPLMTKGKPLGVLCLGTREPREFAAEEISLLTAIGNQIAVAVENTRLYEELSRKEQLRGELLRRMILVQEDERKRIARELHDETSQTLTALLFALDSAADTCAGTEPTLLQRMRSLTLNAIDGVHKVIFDLRPTMLDQLGLVAALRWYAETRLAEGDTRVEIGTHGEPRRLSSIVETALFRTVQEAINNVARHAAARHLKIAFQFDEQQVQVRVEDDGIGFELGPIAVSPHSLAGLGLLSMEERMSAVGGEFYMTSALGQGTTIVLRAPITGGGNGADPSAGRG